MNMRKFYLITTTVISIFLSIAGIVIILNINGLDIERYAAGNAYIDEQKPDNDSLYLYIGKKAAHTEVEFDLLAGSEPISAWMVNFTNKNILSIVSFLRKQMYSYNYNDLDKEDTNIHVFLKEDQNE